MGENEEDLELKKLILENKKNGGSNVYMFVCCAITLLGTLSVGLLFGITSPMIPDIQQDKKNSTPHLDSAEASWFGGILLTGGIVGGIAAGYIMQKIGRKMTSVISAIPYILGLVFIIFATELWMLYVGRVISGLGTGISSLIVPVYIGEIAPSNLRGMLGSAAQLCIVSGILIIYAVGIALPWRWLAASATVLPGLLLFFSLFIVETPRYLLLKGKTQKAKESLQLLRGKNANIDDEFAELEASLNNEVESATWLEILRDKKLLTPALLSLAAMYFQQMSGINCVMFFAKPLFLSAGFTNPPQLTLALLSTAGTQVLFTFISCLIIDKTGRRSLIVIGGVIMTASLIVFGLYFQLLSNHNTPSSSSIVYHSTSNLTTALQPDTMHSIPKLTWMALVGMVVFIASYSIGIGPIAWLLVGEIIPLRARGNAAGLSTSFNLFIAFVLTSSFNSMLQSLTPQGTFWFFAANSALSIFFAIFFLPETKGKSLEEIEANF